MANGTKEARSKLVLGVALVLALGVTAALLLSDGRALSPQAAPDAPIAPSLTTDAASLASSAAVGSAVITDAEPPRDQVERTAFDTTSALRALVRSRLLTMNDAPKPYARTADPLRVVKAALDDERINPFRRQLGEAQLAQFAELVRQHAERVGVAFDRAAGLRAEAMLRSVHADRFTIHMQPDGRLPELGAGEDRHRTSIAAGIRAHDLICRTSLHSADNGDFIHVVTYVTREQEPEYFFAAELLEQLRQQQEQELRAFVARVP